VLVHRAAHHCVEPLPDTVVPSSNEGPRPMTNRPYDLMLFDLDGTLVETAPEIMDAVNDTLGRFKLAPVTQRQVQDWIGHGTLTLLVQAVADRSGMRIEAVRASDLLRQMVPVYDGFYQQRCGSRSHLYPLVRETLHSLRAQGVKLAVVTNKESRYTRVVLEAHQLRGLFDEVVSGDTFAAKKPDPVGCCTAWQSLAWPGSAPCLSATPASTPPPRATREWRCGCCPTATTWASPLKPAPPTGSLPTFQPCRRRGLPLDK